MNTTGIRTKIVVIDTATVGIYGTDLQGNPWTTFSLFGDTTVTCARCGAAIRGGYSQGKHGEEQHFCSRHIQWVYPELDASYTS